MNEIVLIHQNLTFIIFLLPFLFPEMFFPVIIPQFYLLVEMKNVPEADRSRKTILFLATAIVFGVCARMCMCVLVCDTQALQ
jgi:hypothetical protein